MLQKPERQDKMTSIDNLVEEIMQGLQEYANLADTAMKKAVRKTAYCSCGRKQCAVAGAFD